MFLLIQNINYLFWLGDFIVTIAVSNFLDVNQAYQIFALRHAIASASSPGNLKDSIYKKLTLVPFIFYFGFVFEFTWQFDNGVLFIFLNISSTMNVRTRFLYACRKIVRFIATSMEEQSRGQPFNSLRVSYLVRLSGNGSLKVIRVLKINNVFIVGRNKIKKDVFLW